MQLELIRFFTSAKPLIAAAKVSERTTAAIKNLMAVPSSTKVSIGKYTDSDILVSHLL